MKVLGIDSSFISNTSVGIFFSEDLQIEINLKNPLSQEEKLLSAVDACFNLINKDVREIDLIAVGIGPGSFTGLRIGIASAKGLAWSMKKEIMGLSSLELLVQSVSTDLNKDVLVVPVVDARMNRVFAALFQGYDRVSDDLDIEPEKLIELIVKRKEKKIIFLGDGLLKYRDNFSAIQDKDLHFLKDCPISGRVVCQYALSKYKPGGDSVKELEPVYLRMSEAEAQWEERKCLVK